MKYSIRYTYTRSNQGGIPGVGNNLAHHHVISYPHMFGLGAIILAAAIIDDKNGDNYCRVMNNYYKGMNMTSLSRKSLLDEVDCNGGIISLYNTTFFNPILNTVAWTKDNLFVGPAATFRNDDPSQRNDMISCSLHGWDFVRKVDQLLGMVTSAMPNRSDIPATAIRLSETTIGGIAERFIEALFHIQNPQIRETTVGDWVAVPNDGNNSNLCYPVLFSSSACADPNNLMRAKLKLKIVDNKNSVRSTDSVSPDRVSRNQAFVICGRDRNNSCVLGYKDNMGNNHSNQGAPIKTPFSALPVI